MVHDTIFQYFLNISEIMTFGSSTQKCVFDEILDLEAQRGKILMICSRVLSNFSLNN